MRSVASSLREGPKGNAEVSPAFPFSSAPGGGDPKTRLFHHDEAAHALRIARLREAIGKLEAGTSAGLPASLPLGLKGGARGHTPDLPCGVLNEVVAAHEDRPAAFGFMLALTAVALRLRSGPAALVISQRALRDFGFPYGHGLAQLGLDVGRLLIVETRSGKDALWALEETLRSHAGLVMVVGVLEGGLDLTASRRLNLAAAAHAIPLGVLRGSKATAASAAAMRWRIASTPAACDRFGTFAHCRWRVTVERCRNGRPGDWQFEWDHVAHRFRLVESLADRAPAERSSLRRAG